MFCIHAAGGDGRPLSFNPVPEMGKNYSILGEQVESAWCCGPKGKVTPEQAAITKRKDGTSVATPIAVGVMALILELAYQPAVKQKFRPDVLYCLQSYQGMDVVLGKMTKQTGDYRNIVPWYLLKANADPMVTAEYISLLLDRALF